MAKKRLVLTGDQARFSNDFSSAEVDLEKNKKIPSKIRVISAGPGSGKTTAIEETLLNFVETNESVVDKMIENEQKILIIVFGKTNKKELETRFKKSGLPMDLFEISTVNSLFFRHAKELSKEKTITTSVIGGFEINYTESTFSKEKIKTVLSTFVKTRTISDISPGLENEISPSRTFSENILNENFISKVWSLVNAFFSSSYSLKEKLDIEREAKFFGKKDVSFDDISFNDNDIKTLLRVQSIKRTTRTVGEIFIEGVIKRINFMANYKELVLKEKKTNFNKHLVVEIESIGGEKESTKDVDMGDTEIIKTYKNIFTVPHSFYYKTILIELLQNRELAEKLLLKYVRIIGDEFQDNTLSLLKFLVHLLEHRIVSDVSMVGDSKQRIYGFSSSDNFDLLKYCLEEKELLKNKGIQVEEYTLNQTHRFGEQIAKFVNFNFKDSDIIGKQGVEDFVYPETLKREDFIKSIIAASKKGSTMVICRSNDAAAEMYVRIKEAGEMNVRLETSSKKEITDFVRKGPAALADKEQQKILQNMLDAFDRFNPGFVCEKGDTFPIYEKVMASEKIKSFIRKTGNHQLIRYGLDEVEKYLLPSQKRRNSNQITIGTPYPLKGEEANLVFVDGSFFKKDLDSSEAEAAEEEIEYGANFKMQEALEELKRSKERIHPEELSPPIKKRVKKVDISEKEVVGIAKGTNSILKSIYEREDQVQEKAVLFVAVTRAKTGVFFEDSPFGRAILDDFPLDVELNKKRGFLALEEEKIAIDSIIKKEVGLFGDDEILKNK